MKFGYTDELIKHYEIVDDKIVIKFLNGTKRVVDNTEENEIKVLDLMLEQAKKRDEYSMEECLEKHKRLLASTGILTVVSGFNMLYLDEIAAKITALNKDSIHYMEDLLIFIVARKFLKLVQKENELSKYHTYLNLIEEIEKCDDPNLFKGVKKEYEILNINTLDFYSSRKINKLVKNMAKIKKSATSEVSKEKVLTKTNKPLS